MSRWRRQEPIWSPRSKNIAFSALLVVLLSSFYLTTATSTSSEEIQQIGAPDEPNGSPEVPIFEPNASPAPSGPTTSPTAPQTTPRAPQAPVISLPPTPRKCIGSAPLKSHFYCSTDGLWESDRGFFIGKGGEATELTITGPTLIKGNLTIWGSGKMIILLPLDDPLLAPQQVAMVRSTGCLSIHGKMDIQATAPSVLTAGKQRLKRFEVLLLESPLCNPFARGEFPDLPFNDTLVDKGLPKCAIIKASVDVAKSMTVSFLPYSFLSSPSSPPSAPSPNAPYSGPVLAPYTVEGNSSRRLISAYVTWYHDCLPFYTKVVMPSVFGGILALVLIIMVPMVFWTPKCCLDPKEIEWRKKRKAMDEEQQKQILKSESTGGDADGNYANNNKKNRNDVVGSNSAKDVEMGNRGTRSNNANGKRQKRFNPKAIVKVPMSVIPGLGKKEGAEKDKNGEKEPKSSDDGKEESKKKKNERSNQNGEKQDAEEGQENENAENEMIPDVSAVNTISSMPAAQMRPYRSRRFGDHDEVQESRMMPSIETAPEDDFDDDEDSEDSAIGGQRRSPVYEDEWAGDHRYGNEMM